MTRPARKPKTDQIKALLKRHPGKWKVVFYQDDENEYWVTDKNDRYICETVTRELAEMICSIANSAQPKRSKRK